MFLKSKFLGVALATCVALVLVVAIIARTKRQKICLQVLSKRL